MFYNMLQNRAKLKLIKLYWYFLNQQYLMLKQKTTIDLFNLKHQSIDASL